MPKYRIRLILAVALLIVSLAALTWGLLPGGRTVVHQSIQPTEMKLPTPQGSLLAPGIFGFLTTVRVLPDAESSFLAGLVRAGVL